MNGPAFPRAGSTVKQWEGRDENEVTYEPQDGMTLRDYFAGKALQGILARGNPGYEEAAKYAYGYADAMLIEQEKP